MKSNARGIPQGLINTKRFIFLSFFMFNVLNIHSTRFYYDISDVEILVVTFLIETPYTTSSCFHEDVLNRIPEVLCKQSTYRYLCESGMPSQFVYRWTMNAGKCQSFAYGYCLFEWNHPHPRTAEECEMLCS
uniref:BPTI/Kunitz inhibitor domain-containing protein n=1 Tax=Angiostrongylus cantonensis TaxID=6313 RepID=A0A0K0CT06_ANGCA